MSVEILLLFCFFVCVCVCVTMAVFTETKSDSWKFPLYFDWTRTRVYPSSAGLSDELGLERKAAVRMLRNEQPAQ